MEIEQQDQRIERGVFAVATLVVVASLGVHLMSPAARALRAGPIAGVLLVSDSLDRPQRSEAAWVRYDPASGVVDVVSLPAEASLVSDEGNRRVGKTYAAELKALPEPEADGEARPAGVVDAAGAKRLLEASARTARAIQAGLKRPETPSFLHLDLEGAQTLGAGAVDPDDAVIGVSPSLRGAAGLARTAVASPEGAWRFLAALHGRTRGMSDLSRYDLAVLALEASSVPPGRVRPVQVQQGRRGELKVEQLEGLWARHQRPIQVEVFNGSDRPGAAAEVTRQLRARGVDVVYYGNLPSRLKKTWVVDRNGDRAATVALARWVPAKEPKTWTSIAPERLVHASVLLGNDLMQD